MKDGRSSCVTSHTVRSAIVGDSLDALTAGYEQSSAPPGEELAAHIHQAVWWRLSKGFPSAPLEWVPPR